MTYWPTLLRSDLPFAPWIVVAIWGFLFIGNHLIARAARKASCDQPLVVMQNREVVERGFRMHFVFGQALFAGVIFALTIWLEPHPIFVFLGGGLVVALVCLLGMNLQSLLTSRAAKRSGAATGSLNLSDSYAIRQLTHRLGTGATVCAILGAVLAHLSLWGGALFLGSTALGYRRRIRS
jgi:hypothetical protein